MLQHLLDEFPAFLPINLPAKEFHVQELGATCLEDVTPIQLALLNGHYSIVKYLFGTLTFHLFLVVINYKM